MEELKKNIKKDASDFNKLEFATSFLYDNDLRKKFLTNLSATKMSDIHEIVKKYFDKDVVERSFRTMKGDVQLHPIRLWMPKRVNAHIKICYLSMCLLSLIKFKCKKIATSPIDIINELQTIYKVQIKHSSTNKSFTKVVTQSNQQKKILKALKCSV